MEESRVYGSLFSTWKAELKSLHRGGHVPLLDPTADHLLCLG